MKTHDTNQVIIDPEVFRLVPEYRRIVVFAEREHPIPKSVAALTETLKAAAMRWLEAIGDGKIENVNDVASVKRWREAFRAVGLDPAKNQPAVEAMLRRALKGESLLLGN